MLYATSNCPIADETWDFLFTQMAIDDRIGRIGDIGVDEFIEEAEEEDKMSFHGENSNMDSSESDYRRG